MVRDYDKLLVEDVHLKKELKEKLKAAGVSSVEIERPGNKLRFIYLIRRKDFVGQLKGADLLSAEIQNINVCHRLLFQAPAIRLEL